MVTCAHVVEEFRIKRQKDQTLWMALGFPYPANKVAALPEARLIECGSHGTVDVASFSLREPEVITDFGKDYFPWFVMASASTGPRSNHGNCRFPR